MDWRTHIELNPAVLAGKPTIRDTRLSVEFVIDLLAQGWSSAEVLRQYPSLTAADLQACLAYAAAVLKADRAYLLFV